MVAEICGGSSSRSSVFSIACRYSANSGKTANTDSATASSGTIDSVEVNVRPPATCASRTSRARRTANASTSRARPKDVSDIAFL